MDLDVGVIKELIGALGAAGIDKLNLETNEFKLTLEKNSVVYAAAPVAQAVAQLPVQGAQPQAAAPEPECPCGNVVTSPIVGTFYQSPSPDKPAFVKIGQTVKKGDTLFIVESMKLMNEITSEFDGIVSAILVEDGAGVEYGQPILRIE